MLASLAPCFALFNKKSTAPLKILATPLELTHFSQLVAVAERVSRVLAHIWSMVMPANMYSWVY